METKNQLQKSGEPSMLVQFKNLLNSDSIRNKFQETLGKKAPIFISNLTTIMSGSAELQKCEHMSIISSALMAASMDLPLTPGLGFAGIVPYWDSPSGTMKAQFQIMKKGFIQLSQRTGLFKIINVCEVYEGELKSYNKFTGEYLFDESCKKSENIVGYVSYFRLINGFEKYYYMPIEKLDIHARRYSKSYQKGKGKWADKREGGYEQMCEKTVLKLNLSTYAPLSVDINMMNAIIYDQAEIRDVEGKEFEYIDNENLNQLEEKEVLNIGEGKTLTIKKSDEVKSENLSKSIVNKIDKANGEITQEVKEDNPPAGAKFYTEKELELLGITVSNVAKELIPPIKMKLIEGLPARKTKVFWREAILAFQSGNIDSFMESKMSGKGDTSDDNEPEVQQAIVDNKKEGDLPWEKGVRQEAVKQESVKLEVNKNFDNEKKVDIDIPDLEPGKTERGDIQVVYKIYEDLGSLKLTDEMVPAATGNKFNNLEDLATRGTKSEIEIFISKNKV